MLRRFSFISIEVETMELIENRKNKLEKAITIIDKSKENYFILFFYFKLICSYLYVKNVYSKQFLVKNFYYFQEKYYSFFKPTLLEITDTHIVINSSIIPYEYIISYNNVDECLCLRLFVCTKVNSKKLEFYPSNNVMYIMLCFTSKEISKEIATLIRKCMYYHIKYNKINENALDYYTELEKQ